MSLKYAQASDAASLKRPPVQVILFLQTATPIYPFIWCDYFFGFHVIIKQPGYK